MYLKAEKGTPFKGSLPRKDIIESNKVIPPPLPGHRVRNKQEKEGTASVKSCR